MEYGSLGFYWKGDRDGLESYATSKRNDPAALRATSLVCVAQAFASWAVSGRRLSSSPRGWGWGRAGHARTGGSFWKQTSPRLRLLLPGLIGDVSSAVSLSTLFWRGVFYI